jgi:hypothetical protein
VANYGLDNELILRECSLEKIGFVLSLEGAASGISPMATH